MKWGKLIPFFCSSNINVFNVSKKLYTERSIGKHKKIYIYHKICDPQCTLKQHTQYVHEGIWNQCGFQFSTEGDMGKPEETAHAEIIFN